MPITKLETRNSLYFNEIQIDHTDRIHPTIRAESGGHVTLAIRHCRLNSFGRIAGPCSLGG